MRQSTMAVWTRRGCHKSKLSACDVGTPVIFVTFPGVRRKQRWVAAVPLDEMVGEVRKRVPADAVVRRVPSGSQ
jgi:hypothetical protein